VLALILAGWFANTIGWRWSFILMVALAVVNLLLSFMLKKVPAAAGPHDRLDRRDPRGDRDHPAQLRVQRPRHLGPLAGDAARRRSDVLGLSPAPLLIIAGLIVGQAFFAWLRRRGREGKPAHLRPAGARHGLGASGHRVHGHDALRGHGGELPDPAVHPGGAGRSSIETSFSIIP
jgi:MFS family permease